MTLKKLVERQVRWAQLLSQFDFRLESRSSSKAIIPDALLRRAQDIPNIMNDLRIIER